MTNLKTIVKVKNKENILFSYTSLICYLVFIFSGCVDERSHNIENHSLNSEKNQESKIQNTIKKDSIIKPAYNGNVLLLKAKAEIKASNYKSAIGYLDSIIIKYPDSSITIEAIQMQTFASEENYYYIARSSKSETSCENYLNFYPKGKYVNKINAIIAEQKIVKMNEAYAHAINQNSIYTFKQFVEDYPNHPQVKSINRKIIQLEVDEILADNNTGHMPSFTRTSFSNTRVSSVDIKNDTGCKLEVRYSGDDVRLIIFEVGQSKTVNLTSGDYKIAASACGANYAGIENLNGDYNSTFYISNSIR